MVEMSTPEPTSEEHLSLFGVGPLFVLLSALYAAIAVVAYFLYPGTFAMEVVPRWMLFAAGGVFLSVGIPFALVSFITLMRGFTAKRLLTSGVYAMCRHPVYGAWVVFVVPGLVLITANWAGVWVPLAMYVTLRFLVRKEEAFLERSFGDQYRAYRSKTPAVFPLLWRLRPATRI